MQIEINYYKVFFYSKILNYFKLKFRPTLGFQSLSRDIIYDLWKVDDNAICGTRLERENNK